MKKSRRRMPTMLLIAVLILALLPTAGTFAAEVGDGELGTSTSDQAATSGPAADQNEDEADADVSGEVPDDTNVSSDSALNREIVTIDEEIVVEDESENTDISIVAFADLDPLAASRAQVEAFVERLYTEVLNRPSDPGKATHVNGLLAGTLNGASVAAGFFFSPEMNKRGVSNEQWVDICYRTFLNRNADAAGRLNWLNHLNNGLSRAFVFSGFVNSSEYTGICSSYGITRGSYAPSEPRDQNPQVTGFVFRLYKECLGRTPDTSGLNTWCDHLLTRRMSGSDVAYGFFFSAEFNQKYSTPDQIVPAAYRSLLGRAPDAAGLQHWLNKMKNEGFSKAELFYGFAISNEFLNICNSYGISRGNPVNPDAGRSNADFMVEADIEITGTGTGWHGKLVLAEATAAISFGVQHDKYSALGYKGQDCLMFESVFSTSRQDYKAVSGIGPGKHRIRLEWYRAAQVAKGYVDGQYVGEVSTGLSQGEANRYYGVYAAGRVNGDTVNATFTNIKASGIFKQGYVGNLETLSGWQWKQINNYGAWSNQRIGSGSSIGFHLSGTAQIPGGGDWDSYPTVGAQAREEFTF
ncbi:hypothetical protein AGMMS49983_09270 [Clostridia bacterium]|nr:hypothetical protein AGMMS49983_09270 [Clostridia bacterium]